MNMHERCVQIIETCERAGEPVNEMQRAVLIGAIAFHLNDIAKVERKAGIVEAAEIAIDLKVPWYTVAGGRSNQPSPINIYQAILKRAGEIQ